MSRERGQESAGTRYTTTRLLGTGGLCETWAALDRETGRNVVIKFPRSSVVANARTMHRFVLAHRRVSDFTHPAIAPILDIGDSLRRPFAVLPFYPSTLAQRLASGESFTRDDAIGIAEIIAEALDHAREHGLQHGNLKPSNVLFDAEGRPVICDFGLHPAAAENEREEDVAAWAAMLLAMAPPRGTKEDDGFRRGIHRIRRGANHPNPDRRYSGFKDALRDLRRLSRGRSPRGPAIRPSASAFRVAITILLLAAVAALAVASFSSP